MAANAATLLAGFPVLHSDLVSVAATSDTGAAAQWADAGDQHRPDAGWPSAFGVLDRPNAADIPATPLHTIESVFDDPNLIRQGGWSEARTGPGSLVLSPCTVPAWTASRITVAVLPGRHWASWPPGGVGRRWPIRACRSSG